MIAETLHTNLILIATAYAKATKITLTTVSKRFYGNNNFFEDLRRNRRSISIAKYEEMVDAFRGSWPDGAEWPLTRAVIIPRPGTKIT